jgi:hypothetical protein
MALSSLSCAKHAENVPRASENAGHKRLFLILFWVKPALLAQTQVETLTINTNLPHSKFLVQDPRWRLIQDGKSTLEEFFGGQIRVYDRIWGK